MTPLELDRLTLAEIAVLCERDDGPDDVMSPAEIDEYIRAWHAMTPEQRLWAEPLP